MNVTVRSTNGDGKERDYSLYGFRYSKLEDDRAAELGSPRMDAAGEYLVLIDYDGELTVLPKSEAEVCGCTQDW